MLLGALRDPPSSPPHLYAYPSLSQGLLPLPSPLPAVNTPFHWRGSAGGGGALRSAAATAAGGEEEKNRASLTPKLSSLSASSHSDTSPADSAGVDRDGSARLGPGRIKQDLEAPGSASIVALSAATCPSARTGSAELLPPTEQVKN